MSPELSVCVDKAHFGLLSMRHTYSNTDVANPLFYNFSGISCYVLSPPLSLIFFRRPHSSSSRLSFAFSPTQKLPSHKLCTPLTKSSCSSFPPSLTGLLRVLPQHSRCSEESDQHLQRGTREEAYFPVDFTHPPPFF